MSPLSDDRAGGQPPAQAPERRYRISVEVNGAKRSAEAVARRSLVDFLREDLRLTGTHVGCEHGVCGACSILLDGDPVRACLIYAVQADGRRITTVEGLCDPGGGMSLLQDSFCETHGMQCGYCTPGMLIAARGLLDREPRPSEEQIRDAIGGNLCRCTGYQQIVEAVLLAAQRESDQRSAVKG